MRPLPENFEQQALRRSGFVRTDWTATDSQAVAAYARNGGQVLNSTLRGDPMYPLDDVARRDIGALDAAIAKSKLKQSVLVYRGTHHAQEMKVGQTIRESGYTSTSMAPSVAGRFGPNVVEIELPQGTHAVPGRDIESEILLGQGARFLVVANDGKTVRLRAL